MALLSVTHCCCTVLRPQIGGRYASPWALFSSSQVYQHGLWCQVNSASNAGMGSNIGDMFYPTGDGPDGFTVAPTSNLVNNVPYQQLKCTNQIGVIVDGDSTNNQGVVKCNTIIPNLNTVTNYWVVYHTNTFNSYCKFCVNFTSIESCLLCSWSHSGLHHDTLHTLIKRC